MVSSFVRSPRGPFLPNEALKDAYEALHFGMVIQEGDRVNKNIEALHKLLKRFMKATLKRFMKVDIEGQ